LRRQNRGNRNKILLLDIRIPKRVFERRELLPVGTDATSQKHAFGNRKHRPYLLSNWLIFAPLGGDASPCLRSMADIVGLGTPSSSPSGQPSDEPALARAASTSGGIVTLCHTPPQDYFVVTTRSGKPRRWEWEIRRRPKPMGIKLHAGGFKSEFRAKLAGEMALRRLLDAIAEERRRTAHRCATSGEAFEATGEPGGRSGSNGSLASQLSRRVPYSRRQ